MVTALRARIIHATCAKFTRSQERRSPRSAAIVCKNLLALAARVMLELFYEPIV